MRRKSTTVRGSRQRSASRRSAGTHGEALARGVKAVVERHVHEGCERAYAEVARTFGVIGLFPRADLSSRTARSVITAMVQQLAEQFTKVLLAAALLPVPVRISPPSEVPALRQLTPVARALPPETPRAD